MTSTPVVTNNIIGDIGAETQLAMSTHCSEQFLSNHEDDATSGIEKEPTILGSLKSTTVRRTTALQYLFL